MSDRVEVLWISAELTSAERCVIRSRPGDEAITGTALLPLGDIPASITYAIATNEDWSTRCVQIEIDAGDRSRSINLERTEGQWVVDGVARPDLHECSHVDLGWSPATNTLPLRGSDTAIGDSIRAASAWVRFPELDVVKSDQTYERLAEDRVRYQSAGFTAELAVTADDVVTSYGSDLWRAAKLYRSVDVENPSRQIPPGAQVVRSTAQWTNATVPPALLGHHQTSRWAELVVEQGTVDFAEAETGYRETASPTNTVVIVPNTDHHIEPSDRAVFLVRFYEESPNIELD